MIISLYEQINDLYHNHLKEDWSPRLLELGLLSMTKEIFEQNSDEDAKKIIAFIFSCYSLDSSKLILRSSLINNQKLIAEQLDIPKSIVDNGLFELENERLQKLAKHAQLASSDEEFQTLISLKTIKKQLTESAEESLPKKLSEKDKREFMKRKSQDSLNALKHQKEISIMEERLKIKLQVHENISKNIQNSAVTYEELLEQSEPPKK